MQRSPRKLLVGLVLLSACASQQGAPELGPPSPVIAEDLLESTQKNLIAGWARQASFPFLYGDRWLSSEDQLANALRTAFGRGQRSRLLLKQAIPLQDLQAKNPEFFKALSTQAMGSDSIDPANARVFLMLAPGSQEVSALLLAPDQARRWRARGWDVCLCESLYQQVQSQVENQAL